MPDSCLEERLKSGLFLNNQREDIPRLCSLIQRRLAGENRLPDVVFDLLYKPHHRRISDMFWSPVAVVRKALEWLPADKRLDILDIGCGIGKFCLVADLASKHRIFGIELRPHLIKEAQKVVSLFPGSSISFKCGNAFDYDWAKFHVLYFFNPFAELNFPDLLSKGVKKPEGNPFPESVLRTQRRLAILPRGTFVVTYYTFGAPMPQGFERLQAQHFDTGYLELWKKT